MKHLKKAKKFHRETGQRKAFFRGLAQNLIQNGRIETTEARAKAIRPVVERYITLAKDGTLAHRRLALSRLHDAQTVRKLFDDVAPKYKDRNGGYIRIHKLAKTRKRDGTRLAIVEFV